MIAISVLAVNERENPEEIRFRAGCIYLDFFHNVTG